MLIKKCAVSARPPDIADSIFDDDGDGKGKQVRKSAKISVLKDEESDLFVPAGKTDGKEESQENQHSLLDELEDNSELLT